MSYLKQPSVGVGSKAATAIACTTAVGEVTGSTEGPSINPAFVEVAAGTLAVAVEEGTFVVVARITVAATIGRQAVEAGTLEPIAATFVAELRPESEPTLGSGLQHLPSC